MSTHDFRETHWGHNHYFEPRDDGTYAGPCWYRRRIKVGDSLLWRTEYGYAEAEVLEVKSYTDPPDMFYVKSKVTRRVADPRIISQAELDEAFYG